MSEITDIINAATPGPWFQDVGEEGGYIFVGNRLKGATNGLWQLVYSSSEPMEDLHGEARNRHLADARYIAMANPTHFGLMQAYIKAHEDYYAETGSTLSIETARADLDTYRKERGLDG